MAPWTRRGLAGAVLAVPMALALAGGAAAEISGNCTAQINGADVQNRNSRSKADAIDVPEHAAIRVTGISATPTDHVDIYMEFLGLLEWKVATDTFAPDTDWSSSVEVDDYARYGVGLYRVRGSTGACSGAALVRVGGNPLGTVAGIAGLGATAVGTVAVAAAAARAAKPPPGLPDESSLDDYPGFLDPLEPLPHPVEVMRRPCAFLVLPALAMTGAAMLGAVPAAAAGAAPKRSSLRLSVVGMGGGLLGGLGVTVLLQQYAVLYPTRTITLLLLAAGLATGIVLPTLANRRVASRINRISTIVAQRRAAIAEEDAAPPPPAPGDVPPPPDDLPPPPPDDLPPPPPEQP